MLNSRLLGAADAVADGFEVYCDAMEEFNRDAKEPPRLVAPRSTSN